MTTTNDEELVYGSSGSGNGHGGGNGKHDDGETTGRIDYPREFVRDLGECFREISESFGGLEAKFRRTNEAHPGLVGRSAQLCVANLSLEFAARHVELERFAAEVGGYSRARRRAAFFTLSDRCDALERDLLNGRFVIKEEVTKADAAVAIQLGKVEDQMNRLQQNIRSVSEIAREHARDITMEMAQR